MTPQTKDTILVALEGRASDLTNDLKGLLPDGTRLSLNDMRKLSEQICAILCNIDSVIQTYEEVWRKKRRNSND